jgi:hypothetical protein
MIKAILVWLGQQSINWFVNGKIEVMWTWYF